MTYDNWKCTDPNDRFLGNPVDAAWQQFHDGEISLGDMGEALLEDGLHPYQVRQILSRCTKYAIPKGYFGRVSVSYFSRQKRDDSFNDLLRRWNLPSMFIGGEMPLFKVITQ